MDKLKLLIINANHRVRQGIVAIFTAQKGFTVINDFAKVTDLESLQRMQPDVILYGLNRPDEANISTPLSLKEACPCSTIIILSCLPDKSHFLACLMAGVDGYIQTPILPADLVTVVELTCRSRICFFPELIKEIMSEVLPPPFVLPPHNTHSTHN